MAIRAEIPAVLHGNAASVTGKSCLQLSQQRLLFQSAIENIGQRFPGANHHIEDQAYKRKNQHQQTRKNDRKPVSCPAANVIERPDAHRHPKGKEECSHQSNKNTDKGCNRIGQFGQHSVLLSVCAWNPGQCSQRRRLPKLPGIGRSRIIAQPYCMPKSKQAIFLNLNAPLGSSAHREITSYSSREGLRRLRVLNQKTSPTRFAFQAISRSCLLIRRRNLESLGSDHISQTLLYWIQYCIILDYWACFTEKPVGNAGRTGRAKGPRATPLRSAARSLAACQRLTSPIKFSHSTIH